MTFLTPNRQPHVMRPIFRLVNFTIGMVLIFVTTISIFWLTNPVQGDKNPPTIEQLRKLYSNQQQKETPYRPPKNLCDFIDANLYEKHHLKAKSIVPTENQIGPLSTDRGCLLKYDSNIAAPEPQTLYIIVTATFGSSNLDAQGRYQERYRHIFEEIRATLMSQKESAFHIQSGSVPKLGNQATYAFATSGNKNQLAAENLIVQHHNLTAEIQIQAARTSMKWHRSQLHDQALNMMRYLLTALAKQTINKPGTDE